MGTEDQTAPERTAIKRVLVVDDEQVIADSLVLILKQNGFDAMAVYSGESAVDAAAILKPDILISDVVMGRMNGIEAAIRIRRRAPNCRVILFSGNATTDNLLNEANLDGQGFECLTKPVHPSDFVRLLAEIKG